MVFKIKKRLVIKEEYIPSREKLNDLLVEGNKEKEPFFKEIFVSILRDNFDGSLIKLVDVKKEYIDLLKKRKIYDKRLEQPFKNLIGSNKDNKTSLVLDERVEWYYCKDVKEESIEVDDLCRKPMPLPFRLERSRTKKYYAMFVLPLDDSSVLASIEAEKERQALNKSIGEYESFDFNDIPTNKIDYAKKQADAQKLGDIGEEFVFNEEIKKLKKLGIKKSPIWLSKKNDSFGFDILSYEKEGKRIVNLYIEVKTTSGDLNKDFYVSNLELKISKEYKNHYILARVYKAGDENTIQCEYYRGSIEENFVKKENGSVFVFSTRE